ncbi:MAG: hypothetical protein LUE65_04395 [Clostridiales bacterium]|nr:hypothetical protein [Clostridiales bacterium]
MRKHKNNRRSNIRTIISDALLTIGVAAGLSMNSYAASGWQQEEDHWYYYDNKGTRVENQWKQAGEDWYWLAGDNGGAMAVNRLIQVEGDYYYVDDRGARVCSQWVSFVNPDYDERENYAEYRWYYFQANGKACRAGGRGKISFRTIDGKKYAFDQEGKMLYGWLNQSEAELQTDESDWETCEYYMGTWNDGAMKTGWQLISVYDEDEDDDRNYWFYFKQSGKKQANTSDELDIKEVKMNGRYYGFDSRGVMAYQWTMASASNAASDVSNWRYFNSPEDGARATKGWFRVVPPDNDGDDNTFKDYGTGKTFAKTDAEDESMRWYYADGHGEIYEGVFQKINGQYYGFSPEGSGSAGKMLTGLCALRVDGDQITKLYKSGMGYGDLENLMNGEGSYESFDSENGDALYYFDSDGHLQTGKVTVKLGGVSYPFYFQEHGGAGSRGRSKNGVYQKKNIYRNGLLVKATDDKYQVVYADGDTDGYGATIESIDSSYFRRESLNAGKNRKGDRVHYFGTLDENYYLVDAKGQIIKNKIARDDSEWYFFVDDRRIKMYADQKNLKADEDGLTDEDGNDLKEWNEKDVMISGGYSGGPGEDMVNEFEGYEE